MEAVVIAVAPTEDEHYETDAALNAWFEKNFACEEGRPRSTHLLQDGSELRYRLYGVLGAPGQTSRKALVELMQSDFAPYAGQGRKLYWRRHPQYSRYEKDGLHRIDMRCWIDLPPQLATAYDDGTPAPKVHVVRGLHHGR